MLTGASGGQNNVYESISLHVFHHHAHLFALFVYFIIIIIMIVCLMSILVRREHTNAFTLKTLNRVSRKEEKNRIQTEHAEEEKDAHK